MIKESFAMEKPEMPEEFPDPIPRRIVQLLAYRDANLRENPAYATGFLIERSGKRYLVSNYHVFTGQSPDRRFKGAQPRIPAVIEVWSFGVPVADIYVGADYIVHPNLRTLLCDIAAFPLEQCKEPIKGAPYMKNSRLYNNRVTSLNGVESIDTPLVYAPSRHAFVQDTLLSVSSDTTVFGFPAGIDFNGYAVGRNTKIASQFYGDSPYFLVSGTSYSGCSGAPVSARSFGGYQSLVPPDQDRVKGKLRAWSEYYTYTYQDIKVPVIDQLIGIYSGRMIGPIDRLVEEPGASFVCQVWKWWLVIETVTNGVPDAEVG